MSNEPITDLVQRVAAFTIAVGDLSDEVRELDRRTSKNRRTAQLAVIGLLLDWLLFGVLGFFVHDQNQTSDRLERSVREQCAFNALILGSYRPDSRPAGPERDVYESAFATMRKSYWVLECTAPIVPPAAPR